MKHKKWLFPILSAVVASVAIVAIWVNIEPEEPVEMIEVRHADFGFITSSIKELTARADTIVIGTVSEVAATGMDRGADNTGLPMAYTLYKFDVTETLKGDVADSIYIFRTDPGVFSDMPTTRLNVGETVALYLHQRPTTYAPTITITITITDTAYVPITLDNGVFDVETNGAVGVVNDDTILRPRGISEEMFAEGATFTAAEIRKAIEPASDEVGPVGSTN